MTTEPSSTTRRGFLRTTLSAGVVVGGGALAYAWGVEPHWLEINHRTMPIVELPSNWQGRRLLQLSDLHTGAADQTYLLDAIRQAAELRPDVVVVTGDFMSYSEAGQFEQVAELFAALPRPPLGVFGSFGNHDYGRNWSHVRLADELEKCLTEADVCVLRNSGREVEGLRFVGVEDLWCPRFRRTAVREALTEAAAGPAVVLCHNPDVCDLPVWGDYRGWILSGHTHGGQCRPPFLPAPIVPVRNKLYTQGEVALADGRTLHVSRGVGYTHRIRFNARPEMTLFTMQRA